MKIVTINDGIGALTKGARVAGLKPEVLFFSEQEDTTALSYAILNEVALSLNEKVDIGERIFKEEKIDGILHQTKVGEEIYTIIDAIQGSNADFVVWGASTNLISKDKENIFYDYLTALAVYDYITYYRVIAGTEAGMPDGSAYCYLVSIKRDKQVEKFKFFDSIKNYEPLYSFLENNVGTRYDVSPQTELLIVDEATGDTGVKHLSIKRDFENDEIVDIAFEGDCIRWGSFYENKRRTYPARTPHLYNIREYGTFWNGRKRYFTPSEVIRLKGFSTSEINAITRFGLMDEQMYKIGHKSVSAVVSVRIFAALAKSLGINSQEGEN